MKPEQRRVTRTSLSEVWNDTGVVSRKRVSALSTGDLKSLLRDGHVQFVVANPGRALEWIPEDRCFEFWKSEVKSHLADPGEEAWHLDDFPDSYCYSASRWESDRSGAIVLLELHH